MKLFDDDGDDDISNIEINKDFAKRFEHNKKREDLQKLEEMKKKGLINDSSEDSDSESDEFDEEDIDDGEFFDALMKVRKKDPILTKKDVRLFENDVVEDEEVKKREKVKKPKYLKDVMAEQLIEDGPEIEYDDTNVKTYVEEQHDLRKSVLDAIAEAEGETEEGDEFLKEKESDRGEDGDEDEEMSRKLEEFFGEDEKLDENDLFLKGFFKNRLWIDKEKGKNRVEYDDEVAFSDDEVAIENQEDYEREFNFRFEENKSDRILGHSRVVSGSVRKEVNARKQQRERKKERMSQAEIERKEEVKRLKNLKKREIHERLDKIREVAGYDKGGLPLTEDDLEEEFDPEEFDKKMKVAFDDKYYGAEDVDPRFVNESDDDDGEKPDFDKEDELLGLPKDWDVIKSKDGFFIEREKRLKGEGDDDEEEEEDGSEPEEGKRKRKRKMSLKEKVALDKELDELYKLDYEDAIGDLKTRFKYRPVAPRKYGLNAAEILMMDEKELNQYVSLKKIAPYREQEWKVNPMQRYNFMKKKGLFLQGLVNGQNSRKKRRRTDGGEPSKTREYHIQEDGKAPGEQPSKDESQLSRAAKRRRRQQDKKLPQSRLVAYGKIPSSSKSKSKS